MTELSVSLNPVRDPADGPTTGPIADALGPSAERARFTAVVPRVEGTAALRPRPAPSQSRP